MTALGEAVTHLPWLAPCAASLAALARPGPAVWSIVRADPGAVLLLVRAGGAAPSPARLAADLHDPALLTLALRLLDQPESIDWSRAEAQPIYHAALQIAHVSAKLAQQTRRADPDAAWIAGLLAPLGWLGVCALDGPARACLADPSYAAAPVAAQRRHWGLDAATITRRLVRRWELPAWLGAIVGNLNLPAEMAAGLGADADLLQIVQLAVGLAQEGPVQLGLVLGQDVPTLAMSLGLTGADLDAVRAPADPPATAEWAPPAAQPLLRDLLLLAVDNRTLAESRVLGRMESDCDHLHDALARQRLDEARRLRALNLGALAEFAAGAGHEINNPLAVISGQAQYVLRYLNTIHAPDEQLIDGADEPVGPPPAVVKSLQTIVGQAQRINDIINQLMQFARPAKPNRRRLEAAMLLRDAASAIADLAEQRKVRLVCPEVDPALAIQADQRQIKLALAGLLRNAVEAAPAEGWAGVRVQAVDADWLEVIVEDSGPGLNASQREHMFDPFYSGRQAGRGKGLGLPTAWRIAQAHGGDVFFDERCPSPTRFILRLPRAPAPANGALHLHDPHARANGVNGHVGESAATAD